jgi:hypothetical protein
MRALLIWLALSARGIAERTFSCLFPELSQAVEVLSAGVFTIPKSPSSFLEKR